MVSYLLMPYVIVVVQSLSCIRIVATLWTTAHQASLSFTVFCSLLKFMSIESVMSSSHLILCLPLLFLPSVSPSIRVFSNDKMWSTGGGTGKPLQYSCLENPRNSMKKNAVYIGYLLQVVSLNLYSLLYVQSSRNIKNNLSLYDLSWVSVNVSCSVVSDSLWLPGLWLARLLCLWASLGKNTGVGWHFLLQGIFPTQGANLCFPNCRQILYHLSHQGSPSFWLKIPLIHILFFVYLEKDRRVRFGLIRSVLVNLSSFSYFLFLEIIILELEYWVFLCVCVCVCVSASIKSLVSK